MLNGASVARLTLRKPPRDDDFSQFGFARLRAVRHRLAPQPPVWTAKPPTRGRIVCQSLEECELVHTWTKKFATEHPTPPWNFHGRRLAPSLAASAGRRAPSRVPTWRLHRVPLDRFGSGLTRSLEDNRIAAHGALPSVAPVPARVSFTNPLRSLSLDGREPLKLPRTDPCRALATEPGTSQKSVAKPTFTKR